MSIHIKKISKVNSFCGLNNINLDYEFKDYNVLFANNGSGKTSVTRALELLIHRNSHISKYQTINSSVLPNIEFELSDRNVSIDSINILPQLPFKMEVYNSDFLQDNAPLNKEFGLKKLDDETIVLEGSGVGEETQEIEKLNKEKKELEERLNKIGNFRDIENINEDSDIKKELINIENAVKDIEKVRKSITSTSIQIKLEDFEIQKEQINDISKFNYDDKKLVNIQNDFNELDIAIKKFDSLNEIFLPKLIYENKKNDFNWLFSFDIEKEAGEVSEKVKLHISNIGRKFIEDGMNIINDNTCPFCTQSIENGIIGEYTNYFNESIKRFNSLSSSIQVELIDEVKKWDELKKSIISNFENFRPFIQNFDENKTKLENFIPEMIKEINQLEKLVVYKKGIENKNLYEEKSTNIEKYFNEISKIIDLTKSILESKKEQEEKLKAKKIELKSLKIQKAKKDSFVYQKTKIESLNKIDELEKEYITLESDIKNNNLKIDGLQSLKRPDIKQINIYLKALNLSKYSINEDYKITISESSTIENENLRIVLSEGEKTTITFAYFLARLKLFYNKASLKDLVIVIDDPISSLDEHRVYNTSYLVSKINQEIAGEVVENKNDKAQVFVFTHSHLFMTNIIRILGKHTSYFQLVRSNDCINIISKNKVAGYFDTFYLLLFKEVFEFAEKSTIIENFNEAINFGNKIRILLESFMKTNFISKFIEEEYRNQSSFDTQKLKTITEKILNYNINHQFSNSYFKDSELVINNESDLKLRLINVEKGLHMESHGSIADYYNQYKLSLKEVQKLAKIVINIMTALNPNQTYFYIDAVENN